MYLSGFFFIKSDATGAPSVNQAIDWRTIMQQRADLSVLLAISSPRYSALRPTVPSESASATRTAVYQSMNCSAKLTTYFLTEH